MIYIFRGGIIEARDGVLFADCKYGKWYIKEGRLEWVTDSPPLPVDWRVPQPLETGFRLLFEYLLSMCEYSWRGGEMAAVALVGPPGSGKTTYFKRLVSWRRGTSETTDVESAVVYVEGRPVILYDLPGYKELFTLPMRPEGVLVFVPLDEPWIEEAAWYLFVTEPEAAVVVGTMADIGHIDFLYDIANYLKSIGLNVVASYAVVTPIELRWRLAEILTTLINAL